MYSAIFGVQTMARGSVCSAHNRDDCCYFWHYQRNVILKNVCNFEFHHLKGLCGPYMIYFFIFHFTYFFSFFIFHFSFFFGFCRGGFRWVEFLFFWIECLSTSINSVEFDMYQIQNSRNFRIFTDLAEISM